ncbi:MAG: hypothetical protein V5A68_04170 [Candidatus Thermoplasmatota archaeon]
MKHKKILKNILVILLVALLSFNLNFPVTSEGNQKKIDRNNLVEHLENQIDIQPSSEYCVKIDSEDFDVKEIEKPVIDEVFSDKIQKAVARTPRWLRFPLIKQLKSISNPDEYAELILEVEDRYVDEICFSIAYSPMSNPPAVDLLKKNVFFLYQNDKTIKYAEIIDADDPEKGRYSTIDYLTLEDGKEKKIRLPKNIYYWYIVHPGCGSEEIKEVYNTFWRNYLFNHNDIGYPLLKEKISDIEYLWDGKNYSQPKNRTWRWSMENHPTAVEALSYWIGKTVPYQAFGDRPIQPSVVAHQHNGWCGELQKIAVSAMKAALIPTVSTSNIGEDHVWREFYERGWHQNDNWWEDKGGAVDKREIYAYGWGKEISAIFYWIGDQSIKDVTDKYLHKKDKRKVNFTVLDQNLQPVDATRVTVLVKGTKDITLIKNKIIEKIQEIWNKLPPILKGTITQYIYNKSIQKIQDMPDSKELPIKTIWNYTDIKGKCSFHLGNKNSYIFLIQHGKFIKPLQIAKHNSIRTLDTRDKDRSYKIIFPTLRQKKLRYNEIQPDEKDFSVRFSTDVNSYQIQENGLWVDEKGFYTKKGEIDLYVLDEKNYQKYKNNQRFCCQHKKITGENDFTLNLRQKDYYLVFKNPSYNTHSFLNYSFKILKETDESIAKITHPSSNIFEKPCFNIGDQIKIKGVTNTEKLQLTIANITKNNLTIKDNIWSYIWNTSNIKPGIYEIKISNSKSFDKQMVRIYDLSPPYTTVEKPFDKQIFDEEQKNVLISGKSWDNQRIKEIRVSIDDSRWKKADGTNNWELLWNIEGLNPGVHHIHAKALDYSDLVYHAETSFVINESGVTNSLSIKEVYSTPENPDNKSNVVIYADVTSNSIFPVKKVVLYWQNSSLTRSHETYLYGSNPVQSRHPEDPLKNLENKPVYGKELGQFKSGEEISYWIKVYDYADNTNISTIKNIKIT